MARRPASPRSNRMAGRPDPLDALADPASPATATPATPAPAVPESTAGTPPDPDTRHDRLAPFDALDRLSTPVLLADAAMVIRHVNRAGQELFARIESDIRRDQPTFRARDLIGQTIDRFHKAPQVPLGHGADRATPQEGLFTLGGHHLSFRATPAFTTPAFTAGGQTDGVIVEWHDRTEVTHLKTKIDRLRADLRAMADAHRAGDIDHTVAAEGYDPAFATLIGDLNATVTGHIDTQRTLVTCLTELAKGNLSARLDPFPRKQAFLNDALEDMRLCLTTVIGEIERLSNAIVDGTLDVTPDRSRIRGDFTRIVDAFDAAFAGLNGAFGRIGQQIVQVATTVGQMSQSSQALATQSQIQSSSVDQVSASAEETDAQVKSNAAAASKASQLVTGASEVATVGKGKINEMVTAMQGIRASSQDIAKIIKVIDEIAFQTNLLALNAAVEAARAGQHGRGFAVVAQEVRNLAGRSAKAARETSQLIEDASARVQSGVKIADETSRAFVTIADDIEKVKTLVTEIATASDEQSRGVAQINIAIGEIARSALATSQQAEELAASSNQMQAATESMRSEIGRYRLHQTDPRAAMPGLALDGLPAELMARIEALITGQMGGPRAAPAPSRTASCGGTNSDRDRRGFGSF